MEEEIVRDIFYLEVRNANKALKVLPEENIFGLLEELKVITNLSIIGRKDGLLALEEAANSIKGDRMKDALKQLVMLVVDGTDPKVIEEIGLAKYFSAGYEGYEAIQYMLYLFGVLLIQQGANPRVIEEYLLSILPDRVSEEYRRREETAYVAEEEAYRKNQEELDMSVVEKYYKGEMSLRYGEDGYFLYRVLEFVFQNLDDRQIQRLLREVDNADLEVMMFGLSGESRYALFRNLSKRLAIMVAEDMDYCKEALTKDIENAGYKVLDILIRLMNCAEIYCPENETICGFAKILGIENTVRKSREMTEAQIDLESLMNELMEKSNRKVVIFEDEE